MYRNVILEFLATKRKLLQNSSFFQMTICQIGTNYDDFLIKLINKEDLIHVYHVNEPRIYEKEYSFENLHNSIVMMVMELKQQVCFNYEALNFEMIDPFYLKDLKKINFKSLQAIPIFENDEVCGVIILYYDSENQSLAFTNNELLKLLNELNLDKEKNIQNELAKAIINIDDYYIIAMSKDLIYVNELVKQKLKITSSVLDRKTTSYIGRINNLIGQIGIKKIKYANLDVYYLNHNMILSKPFDKKVFSIYTLNQVFYDNNNTFLFVRINESIDETLNKLNDVLNLIEISDYTLFQYSDDTFIYCMNESLPIDDYQKIKKAFSNIYLIMLRYQVDINGKMNLNKLCDYLFIMQPDNFIFQNYVEWLNEHNKVSLAYNENYHDNKINYEIKSSFDNSMLVKMINLPLKGENRNTHFKMYNEMSEQILKASSKYENQPIMLNLSISVLEKRKNYEIIKKIINNNNTLWINVLNDQVISEEGALKTLSKYKCLNLHLSCDSSVFLNINYMSMLPLFDAIYLQNVEFESIRRNEVGLPQAIMTYAINQQMLVIMENFNTDGENDYQHASCYYVNCINNK